MPYKDNADRRAKKKAKIAAGGCRECPSRAEVGQLCVKCHDKRIAYARERYQPRGRKRGRPVQDPAIAFWRFVDKDGPMPRWRSDLGNCWVWTGTGSKYGHFDRVATRHVGVGAHRVSFWLATGRVPVVVDHLCENRLCVRPSHLDEVQSWQENNRRAQPEYREALLRELGLSSASE